MESKAVLGPAMSDASISLSFLATLTSKFPFILFCLSHFERWSPSDCPEKYNTKGNFKVDYILVREINFYSGKSEHKFIPVWEVYFYP